MGRRPVPVRDAALVIPWLAVERGWAFERLESAAESQLAWADRRATGTVHTKRGANP
jgi:hypothetical protein